MKRIQVWLAAAVVSLLTGCASLPPQEGRAVTSALSDTAGTRLGRAVAPLVAAHPGLAGIHPLLIAHEAFAARALLAAAAERALDVQYYIWHGDETGMLLFEALWQAAERGVRVRLLLDDMNTGGLDETLAALDAHPNIELRLYNPVLHRNQRALNFLTDFTRVNHRMHNKSFTADNQVAVVGGRNIGNEYFGAGTGVEFADLDVIAVGPVVQAVSSAFDLYWSSPSAYPAAAFVGAAAADSSARLRNQFEAVRANPESVLYLQAVRDTQFIHDLLRRQLSFEWAPAQLMKDDPAKTLAATAQADLLLLPALLRAIGEPQKSFDLISPYFVPGEQGTEALAALAKRGLRVRVLTNSLASSDVGAVHAGYAKRRETLLRAGVQLYEIKPSAAKQVADEKQHLGRSSSSSLHAKTFALDGDRLFVGSFNFDPRSALLNTEMGLVIGSPVLAQGLGKAFDGQIPLVSYEVRLAQDGNRLEWIERTPAGEKRYDTEPGTTYWRRLGVDFMSILPIEWLL